MSRARDRSQSDLDDAADHLERYAYISQIEAGAQQPSVRALRQIAPRLDLSVHWRETGEDDPALALARLVLESDAAVEELKRPRAAADRLVGGARFGD